MFLEPDFLATTEDFVGGGRNLSTQRLIYCKRTLLAKDELPDIQVYGYRSCNIT
jgi:hypothetical protein